MADRPSLNVVTLVEAASVSGSAKAVVEFGREATVFTGAGGLPAVRLTVLTFRRGAEPAENALTQTLRSYGIAHRFLHETGRFDTGVLGQIREVVKSTRADVLWTNSVKSHFLVRLGKLDRECPWLAFHHGYTATDTKMLLYNQLDRWSLRRAQRVITVCEPFRRQLMAVGVPSERIVVQHMPVRPFEQPDSAQVREVRSRYGIAPDMPVLLAVGRLSLEKGHADLLSAFRLLREGAGDLQPKLLIVGDGPEREPLTEAAQKQGLSGSVCFAGHVADVRPFYAAADVFVLPSHSEGSPNVLLEAMAAGLPVVTTSVGGIPEMATDGINAVFVPPSQPGKLADAMRRVLNDPALRSRLRNTGPDVLARHSPEGYFRSVLAELTALTLERRTA